MKIDRAEAIDWICKLHPGSIYVICNALARDVYETAPQPSNLYLVHGMGQALAVGMGIAQSVNRHVVVVDGDGNAVMGAAMWTMLHTVENLTYYVLVNEVYGTTGGQELILPEYEPENVFTILIEKGKVGRPKGMMRARSMETIEGYLNPLAAKEEFQAWAELNGLLR